MITASFSSTQLQAHYPYNSNQFASLQANSGFVSRLDIDIMTASPVSDLL